PWPTRRPCSVKPPKSPSPWPSPPNTLKWVFYPADASSATPSTIETFGTVACHAFAAPAELLLGPSAFGGRESMPPTVSYSQPRSRRSEQARENRRAQLKKQLLSCL